MTDLQRMLSQEEQVIHENLAKMGHIAGQAVENALTALKTQNATLAQDILDSDTSLNTLYRIVENECLSCLALRQPVACDLRDLIGSLQIATELERIGDHAKDIAKIVLAMDASDFSGPMQQIAEMGDLSSSMLTLVMEAVANKDTELARRAASEDTLLDELDQDAVSSLLMNLMSQADCSMHCTHLLWIAYHLERIGDRVTNIAERVVFIVTNDTPNLA